MLGKEFFKKITNSFNQDNITSILPDIAVNEIINGRLPQINTDTIFLLNGEICHFIDRAIIVKEKKEITGYEGGSTGWSFRVLNGVNYRVGKNKGHPIREIVNDKTKGIFYITNIRIIFVAKRNGFDKKIDKITAIVPYSNAISIQIGSDSYTLLMPQSNIAYAALKLLKQ